MSRLSMWCAVFLMSALGAIAIADCPDEGVHECACPSAPAGTDPCDELAPVNCDTAITQLDGDFCKRTKSGHYVVNGTSSQTDACYVGTAEK